MEKLILSWEGPFEYLRKSGQQRMEDKTKFCSVPDLKLLQITDFCNRMILCLLQLLNSIHRSVIPNEVDIRERLVFPGKPDIVTDRLIQ
jgi:hypothetical protein